MFRRHQWVLIMLAKQSGTTIIETLVGLALGVFIVGSSIAMLYGTMAANVETLRITRMEHELRTALNLIVSDLRRAGYWANAASDANSNANNNPFYSGGNELQLVGSDCLLFSYDADNDGNLPALADLPSDERFGYRLSNSKVQSRPASLGSFDCAAASADWEDITNDSVVTINNLTFTLNTQLVDVDGGGAGTSTSSVRRIDVSITGVLADDPTVVRTLTESVRVRNDLFTP